MKRKSLCGSFWHLCNSSASEISTLSRVGFFSLLLGASSVLFAQPELSVRPVEGGYHLAWPVSASDFVLQGASDIVAADWQDIADSPQIVGEEFTVTINPDNGERFFRLANRPLPDELPTLRAISDIAFSGQQVAALLEALGGDPRQTQTDERGMIFLLDPERFQAIPSMQVTDPQIIERLLPDTEEDQDPTLFEAFDMPQLRQHRPFGRMPAQEAAAAALRAADLLPEGARLGASHTRLALLDVKGEPMMDEVLLDTQVNLELFHNGIPLVGPGARIGMSFSPDGKVSQLLYSFRPLEEGPVVRLLDERTALERCARLFPEGARVFKPRLMYYAPSVLEATGRAVLPCYECAASAQQDGVQVDLVRRIIPATEDPAFLPAVQLTARLDGRTASGQTVVIGGLGPIKYKWISSSADLSGVPEDASSVEYVVGSPNESRGPEVLQVIVTDANGLEVSATADLGTPALAEPRAGGPEPIAAITDFGVERAVSDLGSGIQSGFIKRFKQSATMGFNFTGVGAWERDFRQGGTGLDHLYVDNVDLTLYIGHGWPGGFTFESNQNDGSIVPGDVVGAWGNSDLEWLCLVSCQVLKWSSGGQNVVQRWGPSFDRMHMLLGFDTNAYDWSGFGGTFANYALGYDLGFITLSPLRIRQSWFLAKRDQQPASVIAGAMGPIGPGNVSNCNEYFWGKGPTGPDISKANIQGWWVLYYQ